MRGRCDKQEFCLRSRAVMRYTRQSEDFLLFLGLAFLLLKGLFFPSQYQYFWVEIVWDKRWHPICKWYMLGSIEDEYSCDEVLKAGRYVVNEGKKCQ